MRAPSDLPRRQRRPIRGRIWVLVAVVVAFHPADVAAQRRRLLHRLPVVQRAALHQRLPGGPGRPGPFGGALHGPVLRPDVRQPDHRRSHRAEVSAGRSRGRAGPALPGGRRSARRQSSGRGLRLLCPVRRRRYPVAVEQLDPADPRLQVSDDRPAVPQERRLLRLPAAVHQLRAQLVVRRHPHHPDHHGDLPLPERRYPAPVADRTGDPAGQGPHLGPSRCAGPGEGGRLLVRSLRPCPFDQACGRRRHLHRRPRCRCRPRTC